MSPRKKSGKDDVPPALARLFGEHEPIAFGTPSQQAEALLGRALASDDPAESRALAEMAYETDPSPKATKLLQIKVSLRRAPMPIWRRLLVEKATTLENLHDIIQLSMGWDDDHLHDFRVGRKRYTVPDDILDPGADGDERGTKLSRVLKRPKDRMVYTYDFGDRWEHDVLLEALVDPDPGVAYPRCVRGARACPPEDCGGAGGYARLVAALSDPSHPSHQEARSQLGRDYDPNAFDLDAVNRRLGSTLNDVDLDDIEPNPWF